MYFDETYKDIYLNVLESYSEFKQIDDEINFVNNKYTIKKNDQLLKRVGIYSQTNYYNVNSLKKAMIKVFDILNYESESKDFHELLPMDIIDYAEFNKVTGNCITHAQLLKDIYSAMGYYARIVRCMPVDIHYKECHVITEVFIPKYNKWVFFDAANKAYFENENSDLLSTIEIRNAFINKSKFKICIDTNNKKYLLYISEKYLAYLTKNFIRFNTPINECKNLGLLMLTPINYFYSKKNKIWKTEICGYVKPVYIVYTQQIEKFWGSPLNKRGDCIE